MVTKIVSGGVPIDGRDSKDAKDSANTANERWKMCDS